MDAKKILDLLPDFDGYYELIADDQSVGDIINEVLAAHEFFEGHYDKIALCFDGDNVNEVCRNLYSFCKKVFTYDEQDEDNQMTMSPAAMIHLHKVDCKNYAGFCGGILDALNRKTSREINWCYRFASYRFWDNSPHHVFIVVNPGGNEIWIDPTPGAKSKAPIWHTDRKTKTMALNRVSGIGNSLGDVSQILNDTADRPALYMAVQRLLKYGVMNVKGNVSSSLFNRLQRELPLSEFAMLQNDLRIVTDAAIGGLGENIVHALALVSQALPRASYLTLVYYNMFGWATKLAHCIYTDDTYKSYYASGKDKIYHAWYLIGGDFGKLEQMVKLGAKKKAILGNAKVGAAPAAIAAACVTVIAALKPVIDKILDARKLETGVNYNIDPVTGLPYASTAFEPTGSVMNWIANHPLEIIGGAFAISYVVSYFNKKRATKSAVK